MAKVEKNLLTRGLSGKLGNQVVFRKRGTETLLTAAPGRRTKPLTEAQLEHQQQFREAVIYAKSVMADPVMKTAYHAAVKSGESGFNLAVADYLKNPVIIEVDTGQYTGQVGCIIRVRAIDNFRVKEVTVGIYKSDDSLVESGTATPGINGMDWLYTTTSQNAATAGGRIIATVTDTPGHKVDMTMLL